MDSRRKPSATRVTPKIGLTCGSCGKPYGNPLTHVCKTGTDFAKRKRAAEKAAKRKPAPKGSKHDYTACEDPDCHVYICRVYKEGFDNGIMSCPLPHQQ